MADHSSPFEVYRFGCPHCQKVIRIRTAWAGRKGTCPHCRKKLEFPPYRKPGVSSATKRRLMKMLGTADEPTLDLRQADRLAMLLSQATCRDYQMAQELLGGRALSPRQWRRALNAADQRETMRLRMAEQVAAGPAGGDGESLVLLAAEGSLSARGWEILARFIYFQRHGACAECERVPTGLSCRYLSFEGFLAAFDIDVKRAQNWRELLQHHLGL